MKIVVAAFIVLHLIDGRTVAINPEQVTRLSEAREGTDEGKQLAEGVRCIVFLTDGKYVSVAETCKEVQHLMEKAP